MKKRDLFTELTEGFDALSDARAGEQTLGTHEVNVQPVPDMSAVKPLDAFDSSVIEVNLSVSNNFRGTVPPSQKSEKHHVRF